MKDDNLMTPQDYRDRFPPRNPNHPNHQLPYETEACFQASQVIECKDGTDLRRCWICGKEWSEECNFYKDYA